MDRRADPTEHLPNSYVSRRSTEAQAFSVWIPPAGTLGELTDEARARAATLAGRTDELRRLALAAPKVRRMSNRVAIAVSGQALAAPKAHV